jgi:predicted deacetylase
MAAVSRNLGLSAKILNIMAMAAVSLAGGINGWRRENTGWYLKAGEESSWPKRLAAAAANGRLSSISASLQHLFSVVYGYQKRKQKYNGVSKAAALLHGASA